MAQPKTFANYAYFRYTGSNPKFSFRSYTDKTTGSARGYRIGVDKGNPVFKQWEFDSMTRYQIRVSLDEHDLDGQRAVDFLRSSPECGGSDNGHFMDNGEQVLVYFKEINEKKDADIAIEKRATIIEAQKEALKLKGVELDEMAALEGLFEQDESIKLHRMLDFAANKPEAFLARLKDPSRAIRALINRGIASAVLVNDGRMIKWEGKLIGADFDDAVSNLLKDEKLKKAIELNIQKFGS